MPFLCFLLSFMAPAPARAVQHEAVERFQPVVAEDAELELAAFWEKCRESKYGLFDSTPALQAPSPAVARRRYTAESFRALLPSTPVALGEPWKVDVAAALAFLTQLHPGAVERADLFGGEVPGAWALLRAVGPDAFEILLRVHASFQLESGVVYKPAQFEGRLFVGRDGALRAFSLALPSRNTNVDVNVPMDKKQGSYAAIAADIGWVPRMELTGGDFAETAWTRSVPDEEARVVLRRAFYPFAALDWLPFDEAVIASAESKKPLHLVLLFGCLDDDSC